MTPEERAAHIVQGLKGYFHLLTEEPQLKEFVKIIASEIRAAKAEAFEDAAQIVESNICEWCDPVTGQAVADKIRARSEEKGSGNEKQSHGVNGDHRV